MKSGELKRMNYERAMHFNNCYKGLDNAFFFLSKKLAKHKKSFLL